MIRTFKALGLAFVAMLAMGAFMASAAHAQTARFTYPSGAKATYEPDGGQKAATGLQKFHTTSGTVSCQESSGESASPGTEATEIEATASYQGCTGPFGEKVTIEMNGCSYTFTAETTITTQEITAKAHIDCPLNKQITVTGGFGTCQIHIPAQKTIGGHVIIKNEATTPTTLTAEATLTGITYQGTGTCTGNDAKDGTYQGNITAKGYVGTHIAANQKSISVS